MDEQTSKKCSILVKMLHVQLANSQMKESLTTFSALDYLKCFSVFDNKTKQ